MAESLPVQHEKVSFSSLTAYSSNPTADEAVDLSTVIPKDYILENGRPDVSLVMAHKNAIANQQIPQYLRLILTSRVYDIITETPVTHAINLSSRLGLKVLLKREDLQPVFSFKVRGAYNKMAHLPEENRWKGVIACSAGTGIESPMES